MAEARIALEWNGMNEIHTKGVHDVWEIKHKGENPRKIRGGKGEASKHSPPRERGMLERERGKLMRERGGNG